jgi:hypothetical protein
MIYMHLAFLLPLVLVMPFLYFGAGEVPTYCTSVANINTVHISVTEMGFAPPSYFVHLSITTPVVSALKKYYA